MICAINYLFNNECLTWYNPISCYVIGSCIFSPRLPLLNVASLCRLTKIPYKRTRHRKLSRNKTSCFLKLLALRRYIFLGKLLWCTSIEMWHVESQLKTTLQAAISLRPTSSRFVIFFFSHLHDTTACCGRSTIVCSSSCLSC